MIERNKELKLTFSAKIVYEDKTKTLLRNSELEKLVSDIENMSNGFENVEASIVLECILHGRKIILKDEHEKIQLFSNSIAGRVGASWIITRNKELYSLLKNLVYPKTKKSF